jgi:hypothetical protein
MVLICALKRDCGANIETIRDGRKVESYQLHNALAIASKMVGSAKATKAPKAAKVAVLKTKTAVTRKSAAVATDETPTVEVEEVEFDELASLKAELGLGESYSE